MSILIDKMYKIEIATTFKCRLGEIDSEECELRCVDGASLSNVIALSDVRNGTASYPCYCSSSPRFMRRKKLLFSGERILPMVRHKRVKSSRIHKRNANGFNVQI